jgi:hypothetical protein
MLILLRICLCICVIQMTHFPLIMGAENHLWFPLLIVDESDWVKIVDAVLEQLEIEQHDSKQLST